MFKKEDIKTGLIVLVAVMAGLAVHQKFVAPMIAKKSSATPKV